MPSHRTPYLCMSCTLLLLMTASQQVGCTVCPPGWLRTTGGECLGVPRTVGPGVDAASAEDVCRGLVDRAEVVDVSDPIVYRTAQLLARGRWLWVTGCPERIQDDKHRPARRCCVLGATGAPDIADCSERHRPLCTWKPARSRRKRAVVTTTTTGATFPIARNASYNAPSPISNSLAEVGGPMIFLATCGGVALFIWGCCCCACCWCFFCLRRCAECRFSCCPNAFDKKDMDVKVPVTAVYAIEQQQPPIPLVRLIPSVGQTNSALS